MLAALLVLPGLLNGCGLLARNGDAGPEAADSGQGAEPDPDWQGKPIPYALRIEVRDGPSSLEGKMKAASQLAQLAKEPPDSMLALERRARADTETALKLLHSQSYYDGKASFSMDEAASPVKVTLLLEPGPRYTLGRADVRYERPWCRNPLRTAAAKRASGAWSGRCCPRRPFRQACPA